MANPELDNYVTPKRSTVLTTAEKLVDGPRAVSYGKASVGWERVAKLWSAIANTPLTADECLLMMIALKLSREIDHPDYDNLVDIAGYSAVIEKLQKEREESAQGQEYSHSQIHSQLKG